MLTPKMKKIVKQIVKQGLENRRDPLADKQRLLDRWEVCEEGGKVALIRQGMDCDCSAYYRVEHVSVPMLMAWLKEQDEHEQWLDGPEATYFGAPSEYPTAYRSRDLALEAYEDGHPHVVYYNPGELSHA